MQMRQPIWPFWREWVKQRLQLRGTIYGLCFVSSSTFYLFLFFWLARVSFARLQTRYKQFSWESGQIEFHLAQTSIWGIYYKWRFQQTRRAESERLKKTKAPITFRIIFGQARGYIVREIAFKVRKCSWLTGQL